MRSEDYKLLNINYRLTFLYLFTVLEDWIDRLLWAYGLFLAILKEKKIIFTYGCREERELPGKKTPVGKNVKFREARIIGVLSKTG